MDMIKDKSSGLKPLETLLQGIDYRVGVGVVGGKTRSIEIAAVSSDSRTVKAGTLFVAIRGTVVDGHDYIAEAIENGCAAVIVEVGRTISADPGDWTGLFIEVEDSSQAYGVVAANYYDRPADQLVLIGVTGTNGKTTVTCLLEQILLHSGRTAGIIGTVNNRYAGSSGDPVLLPTRFTTPEAMTLQQLLRQMADAGVQYVIIEVSSHALSQNRVGNIRFAAAAFTNLTRDHLDYHGSMDDYFSAKSKLFTEHMAENSCAVLPAGSPAGETPFWYESLVQQCKTHCGRIVHWGDQEGADIRLLGYELGLNKTLLEVELEGVKTPFSSRLIGRFNIDNMLAVLALCSALNIDYEDAVNCLGAASGVPGRLERVVGSMDESSEGPVVLVDYAHTPDALEKVLSAVSSLPYGELYSVFGCGGDRDSGKRPLMGEIAGRFSDVAIVSDDNPRSENPDEIVSQILSGMESSGLEVKSSEWLTDRPRGEKAIIVERDRRKGIRAAVIAAGSEDVVVIAGKGHETYQLSSRGRLYFDDRLEARDVLSSWTVARVARSVGGRVAGSPGKVRFLGEVLTDSRVTGENSVFVALRGEKYDGHQFAAQAVENGAVCLVVEEEIAVPGGKNVCQIVVRDTLRALGDMALYRRAQLEKICQQTVIAISGSCGKTTVKEMAAAILQRRWPEGADYPRGSVLKTVGNFNNLVGLPLSLLPLSPATRAAILEAGMNQPGELRRLTEIVDPDISCLTNIYGAHLEGLQSIEGVARAKEELFQGTKKSGLLVVNLDDPWVADLAGKYEQAKIRYTVSADKMHMNPDLWVTDIVCEQTGKITFTLHSTDGTVDIYLSAAGEHNVSNALAAAAITYGAGTGLKHIAAGLADFRPADKRMEILRGRGGYTLLNDTYNANPASMAAGLQTLRQMKGIYSAAILGDMLELGDSSAEAHFELGRLAAESGVDDLAFIGEFSKDVEKGALAGGMNSSHIRLFEGKQAAVSWINELVACKKLGQDGIVLVKASRGLRFETIVSELAV